MSAINRFLVRNGFRIRDNPCISPDYCLDWDVFGEKLASGGSIREWPKSVFETVAGKWALLEDDETGDCAWKFVAGPGATLPLLEKGCSHGGATCFPASFANLLVLKNLIQEFDPASTIFPTAGGNLGKSTLGVGARFTTLHWPAVDWAMSALDLGMTANQNSIPRELVYDVDAMLESRLDSVPFPFVGTDVPEGHQGQSVEGMSHGCVLEKLRHGFHRRRLAWSFNADHQPIGGKFDGREDRLVQGCVLASYITFDLSPELAQTVVPDDPGGWISENIPAELVGRVKARVLAAGLQVDGEDFARLLAYVWPAVKKMKVRDDKYAAIRAKTFTTGTGRQYLRELSIDELPGLTTPGTTAIMLALCEGLEMRVNFIAPAFGFQKNTPYPDNEELKLLIEKQWNVCRQFGTSIGFHSGSGKSAENYAVMGRVTGGNMEIKTSGRYTYEMGRALYASRDRADRMLWSEWYRFTVELAVKGAFSADPVEQKMARSFIADALRKAAVPTDIFGSYETVRQALNALVQTPEQMFWFEYNFLFVMAAGGQSEKGALGDHSPAGYRQRARFYRLSKEGRLNFAQNVAAYLIFLARSTGLVAVERCAAAERLLRSYVTLDAMLSDIG